MKKKFLYINPFVYIKCNDNECIISNTQNDNHFYINNKQQVKILNRLYDYKNNNFYVTELSDNETDIINNLLNQFEQTETGGVITRNENENQPVIIPPVLRVSNTIENYEENSTEYLQDIKSYVHNLHICLNTFKGKQSEKYFDSYKQFESPKYSNQEKNIDYELLISQLEKIDNPPHKIILSGSNIFNYNKLKDLTLFLFKNFKKTVITFLCDISDYIENKEFFKSISQTNYYIKLSIDTAIINSNKIEKILNDNGLLLNFMVTNIVEAEKVFQLQEKYQIKNSNILPYFNGNNFSFFKENIFLEKEDILIKQDILDITAKEIINKQLFGNIYISETEDIYLNPNTKNIGNIKTDELYFALYKSLATKQHYPWFLTREQVGPCKNCVFSKLCPTISNYELFLNKFNFCKINEK